MANSNHTNGTETNNPTSKSKLKSRTTHLRDDFDNFACGDLGYGFCLKPGGVPVRKFNPDTLQYEDELPEESLLNTLLSFSNEDDSKESFGKLRSNSTPCLASRNRLDLRTFEEEGLRWGNFPVLDGVPLGTSLRQQRELYAVKMTEYLERKKMFSKSAINEGDEHYSNGGTAEHETNLSILDARNIQIKLQSATEEVEVLQCELEACKRQLDSKYRAIQILKSQSMLVNETQKKFVETSVVMKKSLEKEVNSLQFELDAKLSSLMQSEQTWAERFDRMCLENAALMATLQARSDELRKMHTEKMALVRERDELLARMDAKERLEYDRESKMSNNNSVSNSSCIAEQLAVLGACACRGSKPEPCRCARAAAKLKKENQLLMGEVERLSHELAAAQLSADSFRLAFEDQLDHNSTISWHVAQDINRKKKSRRQRLPWRRKSTDSDKGFETTANKDSAICDNDENMSSREEVNNKETSCDVRSIGVQASQPEPDLVEKLIELLNDRSQALAHQRLVAKMLARRTQDLEQTMARLNKLTGSHEV